MSTAGWFPDPEDSDQWRWFDGDTWTEQTAPMQAAEASTRGAVSPTGHALLPSLPGRPILELHGGRLGGRTIVITDAPAIGVHDAGTLMRSERAGILAPYPLDADLVVATDRSRRVSGSVDIPGVGPVQIDTPDVAALADGWQPDRPGRCTSIPISVTCRHDDEVVERTAHVDVDGGRLRLVGPDETLCDLPVAGLPFTLDGDQLHVLATVSVAGREASDLTIHLPGTATGERVRALLGDGTATEGAAAVDDVVVTGSLGSARFDGVGGEALLTDDALVVRCEDVSHRFSTNTAGLVVAGADDRLVIADEHAGPVLLRGVDSHLMRALAAHEGIGASARSTLAGPSIPCETAAGEPVLVAVAGSCLRVTAADGVSTLELDRAQPAITIDPDHVGLRLGPADDPSLRLRGTADTMGAIRTAIDTEVLLDRFADRTDDLVRAVVAVEGDHLLSTIVGPIVEAHRQLVDAAGEGALRLDTPVVLPDDDSFVALAAALVQGSIAAERHLELLLDRLPFFLTRVDGAILDPDGRPPVALKVLEGRYRNALGAARPLGARFAGVHEPLHQALIVLGVEPTRDFGVAALSSLAGAVINPVFLLTGATQAFAAHRQSGKIGADREGNARRIALRSVDRWNHAVGVQLAPFAHQVADGLFPVRWEAARLLADRRPDGGQGAAAFDRRLARRLARIRTLLALPVSPGLGHARQLVVDDLKVAMNDLDTAEPFAEF